MAWPIKKLTIMTRAAPAALNIVAREWLSTNYSEAPTAHVVADARSAASLKRVCRHIDSYDTRPWESDVFKRVVKAREDEIFEWVVNFVRSGGKTGASGSCVQ